MTLTKEQGAFVRKLRTGPGAARCRRAVLARETTCVYCGRVCSGKWPNPLSPTIEHIPPLHTLIHLSLAEARRIANDPARARLACLSCNSSRTQHPSDVRAERHQRVASREW
jgi:5-methylcytosine-specific restriction endonuclease McrA